MSAVVVLYTGPTAYITRINTYIKELKRYANAKGEKVGREEKTTGKQYCFPCPRSSKYFLSISY